MAAEGRILSAAIVFYTSVDGLGEAWGMEHGAWILTTATDHWELPKSGNLFQHINVTS